MRRPSLGRRPRVPVRAAALKRRDKVVLPQRVIAEPDAKVIARSSVDQLPQDRKKRAGTLGKGAKEDRSRPTGDLIEETADLHASADLE